MTKTKKPTPKEVKEQQDKKQEEETAAKIEKILKGDKQAIQPYLVYSEHGIKPAVRLVPMPKE